MKFSRGRKSASYYLVGGKWKLYEVLIKNAMFVIQANAKINLDFKILGRRSDGYHAIESTFQSINVADFISMEKAPNYFSGAIVCHQSENTVFRAKNLLEQLVRKKLPCHIHIQKAIPISAGLGGGSADAAATLFGLNLLYELNVSMESLAKIGMKIGSDVPFFLYGGTCFVSGIGEIVKPITVNKKSKFFVLFRPHKRVSTKMMYELHDKTGKDFLTLCETICPEIKNLKKYFNKFSLELFLSGSGPTVFCQMNRYSLAREVSEGYPEFNGDIYICQTQNEALKVI